MKKVLHSTIQAILLFVAAAGIMAGLASSFAIAALTMVYFREGRLQSSDLRILGLAAKWLLASGLVLGAVWWLDRHTRNHKNDDSFRLRPHSSDGIVQHFSAAVYLVIFAAWVFHATAGPLLLRLVSTFSWIIAMILAFHLRIFLHELGHLVVAWRLGFYLQLIQVGSGPVIWSGRLRGQLLCEWRMWPLSGLVRATYLGRKHHRLRQSLFVLAGPLADGILLWLVYGFIADLYGGLLMATATGPEGRVVFSFFWSTTISAIAGLLPIKIWVGGFKMWSDGGWLFWLWTTPRSKIGWVGSDWGSSLPLAETPAFVSASTEQTRNHRPGWDSMSAFREQQARLARRLGPRD